ncbi:transposable element Tcb1 transposase [Trichonephila clavipes]|nr:transposable element Tcb1 transposase [Trichonephila clavipes]
MSKMACALAFGPRCKHFRNGQVFELFACRHDDRGDRRLRRCVRENRHATFEQLTPPDKPSASQTTVQLMFLHLGLRSGRLVHAPMLTAFHRQQRLEFARLYRHWMSPEGR